MGFLYTMVYSRGERNRGSLGWWERDRERKRTRREREEKENRRKGEREEREEISLKWNQGNTQCNYKRILSLLSGSYIFHVQCYVHGLIWVLLNSQCPLTWQSKWEGPEDPLQYLRGLVARTMAIQVRLCGQSVQLGLVTTELIPVDKTRDIHLSSVSFIPCLKCVYLLNFGLCVLRKISSISEFWCTTMIICHRAMAPTIVSWLFSLHFQVAKMFSCVTSERLNGTEGEESDFKNKQEAQVSWHESQSWRAPLPFLPPSSALVLAPHLGWH